MGSICGSICTEGEKQPRHPSEDPYSVHYQPGYVPLDLDNLSQSSNGYQPVPGFDPIAHRGPNAHGSPMGSIVNSQRNSVHSHDYLGSNLGSNKTEEDDYPMPV